MLVDGPKPTQKPNFTVADILTIKYVLIVQKVKLYGVGVGWGVQVGFSMAQEEEKRDNNKCQRNSPPQTLPLHTTTCHP